MAILMIICMISAPARAIAADWPRRPDPEPTTVINAAVWQEGLYFMSCAELELCLDIPKGRLSGLTLTQLPDLATGLLTLDGVEAPMFTRLSRDEIDRLIFEPAEDILTAHIVFIPEYEGYTAVLLRLNLLTDPPEPPVIWGEALLTLSGIPRTGSIAAADEYGEYPKILLTSPPKKGSAEITGDHYTYTPNPRAKGRDSFTITAMDSRGVFSEPYTVTVEIEPPAAPKPIWPRWLRLFG